MREVVPFIFLLRDFSVILNLYLSLPRKKWKVFDNNQSCIQVVKAPKFKPRKKYIRIKYHHFCSYVNNGQVEILSIDTHKQMADFLQNIWRMMPFTYIYI